MKQCPHCKKVFETWATFCPHDANRLSHKIVLDGKYRLEEKIGEGGMGQIYRATHVGLGTTWAVKILHLDLVSDERSVERFRREAQAASRVGNVNVVEVIDIIESQESGLLYFVMEFLKGINLKERMAQGPRLTYEEIYLILHQVSKVVHDAHIQGIVHRDLKPDNIFLVSTKDLSKFVKVLDFGIAQFRDEFRLTQSGKLMGSPEYMSPEHCDDKDLDARSDVYTLGVDLYEMLTGEVPFPLAKFGYQTILTKHLYGEPVRPRLIRPDLTQPIEDVILKALHKNPDRRQQSCLQLVDEVKAAFQTVGVDIPNNTQSLFRKFGTSNSYRAMFKKISRRLSKPLDEVSLESPAALVPPTLEAMPPVDWDSTDQYSEVDVVTLDSSGNERSRRKSRARYVAEDLWHGVKLELVEIPEGTFLMGSSDFAPESPQHEVSVPGFLMGKFPVTQAQWRAIVGLPKVLEDLPADPSKFKGDHLPVEQVSWMEAMEFCARLSQKVGKLFRLPSEAEWEFACRAGTTTAFTFGETILPRLVNYNGKYPFNSAPKGVYREMTTPVGSLFAPNAFGLYEMHGNVLEWCLDLWHENYLGAPTDGSPWVSGADLRYRVQRGGSWNHSARDCRSSYRYGRLPDVRNSYLGFRVVTGLG